MSRPSRDFWIGAAGVLLAIAWVVAFGYGAGGLRYGDIGDLFQIF